MLILARLEEYSYAEAAAIATVLLGVLVRHPGRDQLSRTAEQAVCRMRRTSPPNPLP